MDVRSIAPDIPATNSWSTAKRVSEDNLGFLSRSTNDRAQTLMCIDSLLSSRRGLPQKSIALPGYLLCCQNQRWWNTVFLLPLTHQVYCSQHMKTPCCTRYFTYCLDTLNHLCIRTGLARLEWHIFLATVRHFGVRPADFCMPCYLPKYSSTQNQDWTRFSALSRTVPGYLSRRLLRGRGCRYPRTPYRSCGAICRTSRITRARSLTR